MRKRFPTATAIFLTACGGASVATDNLMGNGEANAAAQRQPQNGYDPNAGLDDARAAADYTNNGGMPGCFDPSLSGRQRAVAERLGGVPCSPGPQTAPAGATPSAALTRDWVVGTWVGSGQNCDASADVLRISGEGWFNGAQYAGDWRLGRGQIVFTYRDTSQFEGELVTSDMEAAAPLRTVASPAARLPDDTLSLGPVIWRRCSTDPDFYLR